MNIFSRDTNLLRFQTLFTLLLVFKNTPNWYFPVLGFCKKLLIDFDFRGSLGVLILSIAYLTETNSLSSYSLGISTSIFLLLYMLVITVSDCCCTFPLHKFPINLSNLFRDLAIFLMVFWPSLGSWIYLITYSVRLSIWVSRTWIF